jgi:hypothetical protein
MWSYEAEQARLLRLHDETQSDKETLSKIIGFPVLN